MMAGTMEDETNEQWDQRTINSYSEGFEFRQQDTAANNPIVSNPHGSSTPEFLSWDAGWNAADTATGNPIADGIKMCVAAPERVAPL